jgi:hypothetical protein
MHFERDHKPTAFSVFAVYALAHFAALVLLLERATAQSIEGGPAGPYPEVPATSAWEDPGQALRPLPSVAHADYQQPLDAPMMPCRRASILDEIELDVLVRGYYLNDQRIEWTGLEATFGAEAVVAPVIRHCWSDWETTVEGEFYVNQPFNRNVLVDTAERASYVGNFEFDPFEISQLSLSCQRGDLMLKIGKMETPFGRTHFPLFTNARLDAPFIRTEAILWRETGVLMRYTPGPVVADVALTNGCEDQDTNSSKALVTRLGLEYPGWGVGISLKTQDGIGSETQKQFNNHVGMDFVVRRGPWSVSGEVIHDEYGFRRPGFDPLDITWGRSIYYRDQNAGWHEPINGIGYYLNLGYCGQRWSACLNYGEYHPQQLGDPRHDTPNRRGIVKVDYHINPCSDFYTVVMQETEGFVAQDDRLRRGSVVLCGFQWKH